MFYQKLNRHQSSSEKSKRLDLKRVKEQDLKLAMLVIPSLKSLGISKGRFSKTQARFRSKLEKTALLLPSLTAHLMTVACMSAEQPTTWEQIRPKDLSPSTVSLA